MTLYLAIGLMCLLATLFVAWPMYRQERRLSGTIAGSVVAVVALAVGLYAYQGSPTTPSGAGAPMDVEQMVASLAARLQESPEDLNGWKMLGRSYMTLGDFAGAVHAYERASELEAAGNAQTLVDLGAAILARDNSRIEGRTSALFESALAIEPNNPQALFYGGIAALNRGDSTLAADRWEILLSLNPPEEIRGIIEQRVAEWRGEPIPETVAPDSPPPQREAVVRVTVSLSAAASEALPDEASVFVIARDPARPSPPIAVARRSLSELPAIVELGDAQSMIPGRLLSAFTEFEVIARVSPSGQPTAQSGDWYAQLAVIPAENSSPALLIDQQVP